MCCNRVQASCETIVGGKQGNESNVKITIKMLRSRKAAPGQEPDI